MFRKILWLLLIILIAIQFIRPSKNISQNEQPGNIANAYTVPDNVKIILAKACFDCHSNNTRYPWYSNIQPVAWWLNSHIIDGKKDLNFDEFLNLTPKRQHRRMEQVAQLVKEDDMPLKSYTWVHRDALLTSTEKTELIDWADKARAEIIKRTGFIPEPKKETGIK